MAVAEFVGESGWQLRRASPQRGHHAPRGGGVKARKRRAAVIKKGGFSTPIRFALEDITFTQSFIAKAIRRRL
jgi:hypothetical protein